MVSVHWRTTCKFSVLASCSMLWGGQSHCAHSAAIIVIHPKAAVKVRIVSP